MKIIRTLILTAVLLTSCSNNSALPTSTKETSNTKSYLVAVESNDELMMKELLKHKPVHPKIEIIERPQEEDVVTIKDDNSNDPSITVNHDKQTSTSPKQIIERKEDIDDETKPDKTKPEEPTYIEEKPSDPSSSSNDSFPSLEEEKDNSLNEWVEMGYNFYKKYENADACIALIYDVKKEHTREWSSNICDVDGSMYYIER